MIVMRWKDRIMMRKVKCEVYDGEKKEEHNYGEKEST